MSNWDTTTPAGSDLLSQGDDVVRGFKTAIQTALRAGEVAGDDVEGVEAIFPGASPSTAPVFRYRGLKDTTANRPTAGQYGLFFDTTRNVLQRDNGTSWDDVGVIIPSGTKMVFYQASAPTGWTAIAVNDKFLRIVTSGGTGGSSGGSGLTPSDTLTLSHTHTIADHTHTISNHVHYFDYINNTLNWDATANSTSSPLFGYNSDGDDGQFRFVTTFSGSSKVLRFYQYPRTKSDGGSTSSSSSTTPGNSLTTTAFQYADVIVASKD